MQLATQVSQRPPSTERRYCLLIESLDDEYEVQVVRGAMSRARELGAQVVCIVGCAVGDPDPERRVKNFAFDLANADNCSGLIALTSAIGSAVGPERLTEWFHRFGELPWCSVGIALEAGTCLGVDNRGGTASIVRHLVEVHGCRRLAIIRGPADSTEAVERALAARGVLAEAGIEVDARLIVDGNFTKEAGRLAICTLLDERGVSPIGLDAVVAANDYMALGAIRELQRRGLRVPEDIKVVGFDDIASARLARPPLSTVRQPIEQLGARAVSALERLIEGKPTPSEVLETELVLRRSCGCNAVDVGLLARQSVRPLGHSSGASLVLRRQVILAETMRAGQGAMGTMGRGWETLMLDTLVRQLDPIPGAGEETLAVVVERLLRKWDPLEVRSAVLQDVLTVLRREVALCIGEEELRNSRLESAIHEARVVASEGVAAAIEARGQREMELLDHFEREAHRVLFQDPFSQARALQGPLKGLGIDGCVLAALDDPAQPLGQARVQFAFGAGPPRGGERSTLSALVLHPVLHRLGRGLLLLPLTADQEPAGVCVLATDRVEGLLLDHLGIWMGTLLRVARLRGE